MRNLPGKIAYARKMLEATPGAPPLGTFAVRTAIWRLRTAMELGTSVDITPSHFKLYCPPEWRGNAKMNYLMRDALEPEIAALPAFVGEGDLVIDVGAHYGLYTLVLASLVGGDGDVYAFEPSPHAMNVVSRNVSTNGLSNVVTLVNGAAAETDGTASFWEHADPSRASLGPSPESVNQVEVKTCRIDRELAGRTRPVSFIKIDVEGFELGVLKGAESVISKDRPVVLLEDDNAITSAAGEVPGAAIQFLRDHGYAIRVGQGRNSWAIPR